MQRPLHVRMFRADNKTPEPSEQQQQQQQQQARQPYAPTYPYPGAPSGYAPYYPVYVPMVAPIPENNLDRRPPRPHVPVRAKTTLPKKKDRNPPSGQFDRDRMPIYDAPVTYGPPSPSREVMRPKRRHSEPLKRPVPVEAVDPFPKSQHRGSLADYGPGGQFSLYNITRYADDTRSCVYIPVGE